MKIIAISYEIVTQESAKNADVAERGWIDKEGVNVEPDKWDIEDGKNAVDIAVKFLQNGGAVVASSTDFHTGAWYSDSPQRDNNGNEITFSFHLKGFSPDEEEKVFEAMKRR